MGSADYWDGERDAGDAEAVKGSAWWSRVVFPLHETDFFKTH